MKNEKSTHAWVTRTEVNAWVKKRLLNKYGHPEAEKRYEELRLITTLKGATTENRDLLEDMKDAWRKRRNRLKPKETKEYSFELSKAFKNNLNALTTIYKNIGKTKTKAQTLDLVIEERLTLGKQLQAERKDEAVFRKQTSILKSHLHQALIELHECKLRLSEANVDITEPLETKQKRTAKSLATARYNDVLQLLPFLPARTPIKPSAHKSPSKKVVTKKNQPESTTSPSVETATNAPLVSGQKYSSTSKTKKEPLYEASVEVSQLPVSAITASLEKASSTQSSQTTSTSDQPSTDSTRGLIASQIELAKIISENAPPPMVHEALTPHSTHDDRPTTPEDLHSPTTEKHNECDLNETRPTETSQDIVDTTVTSQSLTGINPTAEGSITKADAPPSFSEKNHRVVTFTHEYPMYYVDDPDIDIDIDIDIDKELERLLHLKKPEPVENEQQNQKIQSPSIAEPIDNRPQHQKNREGIRSAGSNKSKKNCSISTTRR